MAAVGVIAALATQLWESPSGGADPPSAPAQSSSDAGAERLAELFDERASDALVEASGTVERLLPDDDEGSRHQRLIVRVSAEQTVLIAHNIDLAPRVPAAAGDTVRFHGEYEWNERGGVVHWTHHDPAGRHPGGWIDHAGTRYE